MIARREDPHPGRAAHLHRHRRAPLPGVRHRSHPTPTSRTSKRSIEDEAAARQRDLRRQRHRPREPPVRVVRDQHRMAHNSCSPRTISSPGHDSSVSTVNSPRAEPKRLRYCLLHTAGIITRSARRSTLRLAANWPWRDQLVTAFACLRALPISRVDQHHRARHPASLDRTRPRTVPPAPPAVRPHPGASRHVDNTPVPNTDLPAHLNTGPTERPG